MALLERTITLDYDVKKEEFKYSTLYGNLIKWYIQNRLIIKAMYWRKSANGNTHIKIELNILLPISQTFIMRAYLRDDVYRVVLDMARFYEGKEVNRLWDRKYKNGKLRIAGKWSKMNPYHSS